MISLPRLVNAALGLWLMVAPAVLDYGDPAQTNDRIVGPLVASMAVIALWDVTRPLRFVNAALGAWLVLSPLVLGYPTDAMANSIAVGVLVVAVALIPGPIKGRYGGGWRELWRERE